MRRRTELMFQVVILTGISENYDVMHDISNVMAGLVPAIHALMC